VASPILRRRRSPRQALAPQTRGLNDFVHQFKPQVIEAGLLADADMAAAINQIVPK
jgi:hypothetical protein